MENVQLSIKSVNVWLCQTWKNLTTTVHVIYIVYTCSTQFANLHDFEIVLPLLRIFEIVQERTTNHLFWLEGKANSLGQRKNNWWAEMHAFSARTWTVSYGVALERSHNLLSLIFWDHFAHFDWDSVLCRTFQNAVADNQCLCLLHMVSPPSAPKFRSTILKLRCTSSKLVSNYAISNLHSAILNLRKFANCAEHTCIYAVHVHSVSTHVHSVSTCTQCTYMYTVYAHVHSVTCAYMYIHVCVPDTAKTSPSQTCTS